MRRKPINAITQNNPNNPQSPFFDDEGEKMNPIAKLHFRRQRLYDKVCENMDSCNETDGPATEGQNEEEGDKEEEEGGSRVSNNWFFSL